MNFDRLELIQRVKLDLKNAKAEKGKTNFEEGKGLEGVCWPGYEAIGLKPDGSPNCVPIKEEQSKVKKEGFPIPSPSGSEDEQAFISRCMSEISGEYQREQALAICYSTWEKK